MLLLVKNWTSKNKGRTLIYLTVTDHFSRTFSWIDLLSIIILCEIIPKTECSILTQYSSEAVIIH